MQDPIGSFERIRELYISYLDTAFRVGDESVAEERRLLLRQPGMLCTEPLVEPIPRYEWDTLVDGRSRNFDDIFLDETILEGFDEHQRRAFVEMVLAGLFPSKRKDSSESGNGLSREARFPPYRHQVQMLERGVRASKPGVVTSGTGSGKTEAFLLPLLARIVKEATSWSAPTDEYLKKRWWHDDDGKPYKKPDKKGRVVTRYAAIPKSLRPLTDAALRSPFVPHRNGERRPAAMRAIILYPMNALVEDQLVRLRKTLDSKEAREVLDNHCSSNRIFFGRYIGAIPVTGHHVHPGFRTLLATPKDQVSGDVYFPEHKDANADRVSLIDLRASELLKRQRKLEELFDYQVGLERGQIQARLHMLDQDAQERMKSQLQEQKASRGLVSVDEFLEIAKSSGKRSKSGLFKDFRTWVGVKPDETAKESLKALFLGEADVAKAPSAFGADDSSFIFPSVDGSEMTNRWDMQEHPPDVLITNVSMLSAMLNREVEEPIFEKTKQWLQEADSYFYLILDELHLQRGAAGTEVAYLIRLLLHRLGLTQSDEQRRKIRVLASSASLPASPEEEAKKSAKYLWDMFGPFGLEPGCDAEQGKAAWLEAIVPGEERPPKYDQDAPMLLDSGPFVRLLQVHTPSEPLDPEFPRAQPLFAKAPDSDEISNAWLSVADALDIPDGSLSQRMSDSIQEAAARIAWACREPDASSGKLRSRAIPISELAIKLFAGMLERNYETQSDAVRGLLFVRGCGDGLTDHLEMIAANLPSFRLHTFFRSIEGLYAPASRGLGSPSTPTERGCEIGVLSIDQSARVEIESALGSEEHRAYELIYCECCGDMFLGGMRAEIGKAAKYLAELLPQEPNLEGLPDQSVSQRFEELSWSNYGLFWPGPWERETLTDTTDPDDAGVWIRAYLERPSGGIIPSSKVAEVGSVLLPGWYYDRADKTDHPRHKRRRNTAGTHVPYACPKCGTSYSGRSKEYRLSPLRNFRAGFAKTTQLIATELFDAQRVSNREHSPKLVSFSDSRQDAAQAALSIERFHHQDTRRELLFTTLRRHFEKRNPASVLQELEEARKALEKTPEPFRVMAEKLVGDLNNRYLAESDRSVALVDVLGDPREMAGTKLVPKPFIAEMVGLGVHPFDEVGQERARGSQAGAMMYFPWTRLFRHDEESSSIYWTDNETEQEALESARRHVISAVQELFTDVVFSKTYFSFEEAGLGYVSVRICDLPDSRSTEARALELAAFIRVLADSYRYLRDPVPRFE